MKTRFYECQYCGEPIPPERRMYRAKYCSYSCGNRKARNKWKKIKEENPSSKLPTGTVGALSELIVCCDLLEKGYSVFRSVSPQCKCDLILLKDKKVLKVEVTTAILSPSGVHFQKIRKDRDYDILASVHNKQIKYTPAFDNFP